MDMATLVIIIVGLILIVFSLLSIYFSSELVQRRFNLSNETGRALKSVFLLRGAIGSVLTINLILSCEYGCNYN